MKIDTDANGQTTIVPETVEENAAVDYLLHHMPIFAGMELPIVRAFMAGITWAIVQVVERDDS